MTRTGTLLVVAAVLARSAGAQTNDVGAPPPRLDLSLSFERYRIHRDAFTILDPPPYVVYGLGAVVGRYWSHHQRTELSVALTTRAATQGAWGRRANVVLITDDHRHALFSVSHVLQLRRNRRVHPQIGLGATLDVERHHRAGELERPDLLDELLPSRSDQERVLSVSTRTETAVRPFGLAALKVYVTPRLFLRSGVIVEPQANPRRFRVFANVGRDW